MSDDSEARGKPPEPENMTSDWYWSSDEERFGQGPFGSRELAAANARDEGAGRFWTGYSHQPTGADFSICADSVIEQLGEDAYELGGDCAEGWPRHCGFGVEPNEPTGELQEKLDAVIREWIDEHDPPSFWIVLGIEEHAAKADTREEGSA